eukprot:371641-Amphidinium_carterae.2
MYDPPCCHMIRECTSESAIRVGEQVAHVPVWFRPGGHELLQHMSGLSALQADSRVQTRRMTNDPQHLHRCAIQHVHVEDVRTHVFCKCSTLLTGQRATARRTRLSVASTMVTVHAIQQPDMLSWYLLREQQPGQRFLVWVAQTGMKSAQEVWHLIPYGQMLGHQEVDAR